MNNKMKKKMEYTFRAKNGYDVILSGIENSKTFIIQLNSTAMFSSTPFANDFEKYMSGSQECTKEGCIKSIIDFIKSKGQKNISFIFQPITGQSKLTSLLKIEENSLKINTNFMKEIEFFYSNYNVIKRGYMLEDVLGNSKYEEYNMFKNKFIEIVKFVKFDEKTGGKKNNSKKSKAGKMTGGQNGEISKTFKRKSPIPGVTPYNLTISTKSDGIINLEVKITSSVLPFTMFKESFSAQLVPINKNSNVVNIYSIKDFFDKKIKKKTYLTGKEYVENGQTILFKFNLNSDDSTVTIGDESISIKTKFKDVLFNLYSNNKLNILKKTENGLTFKSVKNNIMSKISKKNN